MTCWLAAALLLFVAACGGGAGAPTLTPSATVTPAASPQPSPAPTASATVTPTETAPATVTDTATATPSPPAGPAQVIRKGDPSRAAVAFSFDAGADAGFTAEILDTLKANGITASFGVTGKWAEENPELLRRIVQEGHHIINHSYDHPSFTGLSTGQPPLTQAQRWEQLDRTEGIVRQLTGATTKPYFRPPYGDYDNSVNADIYARGYWYNVMWTVDSRGWQGIPAEEIVQRCLSLAEAGAIYIFHVGSASQDASALPDIIAGLRAQGYGIGSVPQVLAP
ncbi:MAG: polysaccharide deacetylase family protein [Chloroflexi bacterium]|nr:polysaccharide deacetylase family protein [Chloroflexota bacterium]